MNSLNAAINNATEEAHQSSSVPDLSKYRDLVRTYIDRHQLDTATFWADKLASLSGGEFRDVYAYANTLYLTGQYQRALHLLKSHRLDKKLLVGRHLAALCLFSCKEYQEALNMLDQSDAHLEVPHPDLPSKNIESAVHLLRGKVHEAMDNRGPAVECFKQALIKDVFCYEAFENLIQHHMMTAAEERQLIDSLLPNKKCGAEESQLVRFLYENILKKYNKPGDMSLVPPVAQLSNNFDVMVCHAERHYYNCNFYHAYKITAHVLKSDPYNTLCLPLHIAILVELKKLNELFYLAHKLVDLYPGNAVAWFAVGCYYYLAGKHEPARRYFSKSTSLSRLFGPAWLAYGHSFAAENEHDQAMAAYFTASQLMKGCHLPMLYIGLEYGLTNNSKLAERFFGQAQMIAPEDPFVLHEMGVIAFQSKEFENAEKYFLQALEKVRAIKHQAVAVKWEPLLNNLGHVCRKLKKYDEALEYHRQSLVLFPHSASSLSAMGYVYALKGSFHESVTCFHKALALRKDDTFSTTMLASSLEHIISDYPSIEGVPETTLRHTYNKPLLKARPSEATASSALTMDSFVEQSELPELPDYAEGMSTGFLTFGVRDTTMDDTEMEDA